MLERIRSAVSFAAESGIRVAFFGVDSTPRRPRVRAPGLRERGRGGRAGGRRRRHARASRRPRPPRSSSARSCERLDYEIPVHWHGHDDFGLATAAAVAAVQAGATWVQGTVNGMGERAGNADLVEVALALEALYGIPTRLRLERARELCAPRAGALGDAARAVEARHRRQPLHARVGRRRGAVPRSACDRAVRVRARRRDAGHRAREEERARLDPDQGGRARPRRSGGVATRRCSRRSSALGTKKRGLVTDAEFRRLVNREGRQSRVRS